MDNLEFIWNLTDIDNVVNERIEVVKMCFIIVFTVFLFAKIMNFKNWNKKNLIFTLVCIPLISFFAVIIKNKTDMFFSWLVIILFISLISYFNFKRNLMYDFSLTIISFSISYVLYIISVAIAFIPAVIFKLENDYIGLAFIGFTYILLAYIVSKLKKIKVFYKTGK